VNVRLGRKLAAGCVLIAAYAGLSHYCNTGPGSGDLGAALALGPLVAVGLTLLWRDTRPLIATLSTFAGAVLLYDQWPLLQKNFPMVYLLQECGMYGILAFGFGRSLGAGDTALCTRLADKLHGPLTSREVRYTRRVTLAWALFFSGITVTVFILFISAPLRIWSLFVNFAAPLLVAAMFVSEYALRRRVLPQTDRRGILATVRVFLTSR
jgi:uncharacterized membrane protein